MKKWLVYSLLAGILIIGASLRNYNLTVWPREGATFDEFAWTFQGLSIWEKGVPTSWSPHAAYKNKVDYYNPQGAHFVLVTPYLEHPPLFGLIAGGYAYMNGMRSFDDVTIPKIRPLALLMGIVAIIAVFLLTKSVYGESIGLIASGIYAIIPTVAIGSRLVQNENFFIPVFLFALYFAQQYLKKSSKPDLIAAITLSAVLPLAKIPWIAAPLALIGMFIYAKKRKEAMYVGIATAICLIGWLLYGYVTDATLFTNLWNLQLARYDMAFDSLFILFRDPVIADRALVDGWIYFGWAAMLWLITKDIKKHLPIIFGFLAYFAIFVFAIPGEPLHGWYRFPFYPFLAIAIAVFIYESVNKRYLQTALFFTVTGLSMFAGSWQRILGFSYPTFRTFLTVIAAGALPGIVRSKKIEKLSKYVNYCLIIVLICLTIWTIVAYNEQ